MIDFRYHLVSIIAVFLALTVGLVLGTTMLQDPLLNTLQSETADLRGQTEELRNERDVADKVNAGAVETAEAVSKDVLSGLLTGLGVVVVSAPGADEEMIEALNGRVEEADGEIVGRVQISETFLKAGNATFVDELTMQIAREPDDLTGSPYEKAGAEIGRALAVSKKDEDIGAEEDTGSSGESDDVPEGTGQGSEGETVDDAPTDGGRSGGENSRGGDGDHDREAVLEAFSESGLIKVEDDPVGAADALIVVAPAAGASQEGDEPESANAVLAAITTALHKEVDATAVAGDGPSGRGHGLLAQARSQEAPFATVDTAGRPMGQVVTILALAENLEKRGRAYGIGEGVHGFLPDPLPERREDGDSSATEAPDAQPSENGSDDARRAVRGGE